MTSFKDKIIEGTAFEKMIFSPDGTQVVGGARFRLLWWDLADNQATWVEPGCRSNRVFDLAFSPDSKYLALACAPEETQLGFFALLNAADHATLVFWDEVNQFQSLAFAPDGNRLYMGDLQGEIFVYNFLDGSLDELDRFTAHQGAVIRLVVSPDGKTLASGGKDGFIQQWSLE